MALNWKGDAVKRSFDSAAQLAINATMSAAIIHAKNNHGFVNRTSALERSIRIVRSAAILPNAIVGTWGSVGIIYARRIEMGFQGKDSLGRVVDAPAFPFLRPAADVEYPKLAKRIRRAASVA